MNRYFSIVMALFLAIPAAVHGADSISGQFRTYYSQALSPESPAASVTFEPVFKKVFPSATTLSLLTTIDRPTSRYENFQVPRIRPRAKQLLFKELGLSVEGTATLLDLHRWSNEGTMVRTGLGAVLERLLLNDAFVVTFKATPFYQFNRFRQTTSGNTKPEYGVSEYLSAEYTTGRTTFSADFTLSQVFQGVWKNTFATSEEIAYAFTDSWSLGIGHELLGSFVDESTGRYSSFSVFDNRESRFSAFLGYEF